MKDKFQRSRLETLYKLEYELKKRFENRSETSAGLVSVIRFSVRQRNENDLLKFTNFCDQFYDAKRFITAEKNNNRYANRAERKIELLQTGISKSSRQQSDFR